MSTQIGLCILGSTGSVGLSTLSVLALHKTRFRVVALSAHKNIDLLFEQCVYWQPDFAVVGDADSAQRLAQRLAEQTDNTVSVLTGSEGLISAATAAQTDYVMAAIVGAAGLASALAAANAGKRVLLANKEALVMSGPLFRNAVAAAGAELLPIDSEHNALFQCLPAGRLPAVGVSRLTLTASGGPFRTTPRDQLTEVTPEQACAHPNWQMGRKISVDSATMMNKGLELIEACWLFDVQWQQLDVLMHPQSVVHALVEYIDGSVLAQLGYPDMQTPIAHALAWPERLQTDVQRLDLRAVGQLDFTAVDEQQFPCLRLAREAWLQGGTATVSLNAANEVAVSAFLAGRIRFTSIPAVIEQVLEYVTVYTMDSLENILESDRLARDIAQEKIGELGLRVC